MRKYAVFLVVLMSGCTSYEKAANSFFSGSRPTADSWRKENGTFSAPVDVEKDLSNCINNLRQEHGKPSSLAAGQEQIKKCMGEKGWVILENIWVD